MKSRAFNTDDKKCPRNAGRLAWRRREAPNGKVYWDMMVWGVANGWAWVDSYKTRKEVIEAILAANTVEKT